ncbi:1229_t:CDS:2, partial [Cetraspora pellucida]
LNPKYKVHVDEIRKLLNVVSKKPEKFVGFLVSNSPLSDYAEKELEDSKIKHRIYAFLREEKKLNDRIENIEKRIENQTKEFEEFNKKLDMILKKL